MKRRVLKAGRSSMAVSMPRDFVDMYGLVPGQEIDVVQHGTTLIISLEVAKSVKKCLNISDLSTRYNEEKVLDKVIGALFRQGGDTFEIEVNDKKKTEIIRDIIRKGKLNMYEEPSTENANTIIIHNPTIQFDENILDNMITSMIKDIYLTIERLVDCIKNNYLSQAIVDELISRDRSINDHSDICKRIINKNVLNYKSTSQYDLVDRIEKMGDAVKDLVDIAYKKKVSAKNILETIEGIMDLFCMLLSSHSNFTIKKMNEFFNAAYSLEKEIKTCNNNQLYHCLKTIVTIIKDSYSDLMVRSM